MKEFERKGPKGDVKLIIKGIQQKQCTLDCYLNGELLAQDSLGSVGEILNRSGLYLSFKGLNQNPIHMCICDKSMEKADDDFIKNREIADYFWKEMFDSDPYCLTYPYTTEHRRNWED